MSQNIPQQTSDIINHPKKTAQNLRHSDTLISERENIHLGRNIGIRESNISSQFLRDRFLGSFFCLAKVVTVSDNFLHRDTNCLRSICCLSAHITVFSVLIFFFLASLQRNACMRHCQAAHRAVS
ncbi:hypothetical protein JTE90_008025 [Oedothorax gibbosus]|uniref:Uncharacterized protein n=1 Tax=Oedothorax gibbosus TaxID=931172 RepID=A0AAV6UVF8_9ARAC|nr:hypothetical protein JTE90_008025 [Oedothorax gibbosus]